MRLINHLARSLLFHWRSHLAVALGVMTASATLTGALLVGDSMRGSLRDVALSRLGRVDHALVSPRFLSQRIAAGLAGSSAQGTKITQACPAILLSGGIVHAETRARVNRINILGTDDQFWKLAISHDGPTPPMPTGRSVFLNQTLASQLGAQIGDDVLIRMGKPGPISAETLLGRRDDTSLTLRLTVRMIVLADQGGDFALDPSRSPPNNAWVPLRTLQRAISQPDRVNAILVDGDQIATTSATMQQLLRPRLDLADLGLRLRIDQDRGYIALESDALLIEPAIEQAALNAATSTNLHASPILTYLANSIALPPTGHPPSSQSSIVNRQSSIPYSPVTALDPTASGLPPLTLADGTSAPKLQTGDILLNQWAADDLSAAIGDRIDLTYYVTKPFGRLESRRNSFVLRGIVPMDGIAADPGLTPPYPGVTDTENLAQWDAPFPVDLDLIRDKDERYWDRFRTVPKAFISLADGRRLWTEGNKRFGRSTSIRLVPEKQTDFTSAADAFANELLGQVDLAQVGLTFEPVRQRALAAGSGTTDFGMLFVSFSFFLIMSAAMLVALLFGLGARQRAPEVGILLATGFSPTTVTRLLIAEGAVVACVGAAAGLLAATGYAWLMLTGLKTWWSDAVNAPFLRLYTPPATFVIGFVASLIIAVASITWSVRRLSRSPVHSLLSGAAGTGTYTTPHLRNRRTVAVGLVALAAAAILVLLSGLTEILPQTVGFFGGGSALLIACLSALTVWLRAHHRPMVQHSGPAAILWLGVRNAPRHPRRSLLAAGLIASATFVIASIGAFHLDPDIDTSNKHSPTGGFALLAESAIPLPYDLNTPAGRDALAMTDPTGGELDGITVMPFRLRPGDQASCRGLYRPTEPRIIGATDRLIDRGGFLFASTLLETDGEKQNPWTLLRRTFDDGAIAVIGDEATVKWQLHLGLGKDLTITDERGQRRPLRFVALLAGSVLQDELIVAESNFVGLFPSISGHAFFLIDVPANAALDIAGTLERELSAFAFDVIPTPQRLADYSAVQNTYLRTFQTLGGLGLVLGTVGLAVVLLRNVVERRAELALMRALGFSRAAIGWMVLAENTFLVTAGLAAGTVSALVAIAPHLITRPAQVPWLALGLTILGVQAIGIGTGALVLVPALRAPLLPALRRE